ncbi:MAG TPA: hypothetical protein VMS71_06375 [Candidatus Acidoferrum sp.]|nr:hypothetical protein [Candidatus Acidoferrum sp.]
MARKPLFGGDFVEHFGRMGFRDSDFCKQLALVALFAVAMGYLEAAVVAYLRELYYPEGFVFPLKGMPGRIIAIELAREFATIVMLAAIAGIAGRKRWERFGYFLTLFGIWDIFYYVWLKVMLGWPSTLVDWDMLFLIPVPWIAPVIAPVLVALLMTVCGILITRRIAGGGEFLPGRLAWMGGVLATFAILYSFMRDTKASTGQGSPDAYSYPLLVIGLALYIGVFALTWRKSLGQQRTQ